MIQQHVLATTHVVVVVVASGGGGVVGIDKSTYRHFRNFLRQKKTRLQAEDRLPELPWLARKTSEKLAL